MAIVNFDTTTLLNYYTSRINVSSANAFAGNSAANAGTSSGTNSAKPPWSTAPATTQAQDKLALSSDAYFDSTDLNLKSATSSTSSAGSLLEALVSSQLTKNSASTANTALAKDNDKLFALYSSLTRLDSLTTMATRDATTTGQLPGLDTRFQTGLSQINSFVTDTAFANLTVLLGQKTASVTGTASVPSASFSYQGATAANDTQVLQPLEGLSASDQFTVSITKAGVTTAVPIDLSQISGSLTMDNVVSYVDQQLKADGFSTHLSRTQTGGSLEDGTATWGITVAPGGGETVAFSSATATPSLYIAGQTGSGTDAQGKLVKLVNLDTSATSQFSRNITPDSGTASAKASVVDSNGNVYVVGNSSGSFGSQIDQGSQDVFLSKYDSVGNLQWTKLLGSAASASAYGLALDPSGNVIVAGSTTSPLTTTAVGGGTDSFIAKYDSSGDQTWVRQIAPRGTDSALSVSVGSDGSIYVGGQTTGNIGGQTNAGGTDAYVTKLSSKGVAQYSREFGTSGSDSANSTAVASDGNLLVASVQNGHAVLTKYDSSNATSAPLWQVDLGDLGSGGALGNLAVSGDQVYLSGTTSNANLTASGAATITNANSGSTDAFVFRLTDSGASATPETTTYVGTGSNDRGTGLAVAADGTVYLSGTTSGTFAGETRSSQNTSNLFAAAIGDDGSVQWTRQYAGVGGQSTGASLALDSQGSSVLDALGLPRGKITTNQSVDLAAATTVRGGDYFDLQITSANGTTRKARVTVEKGETLRSLALKVSNALLFDGKATSSYAKGGHALKIAVNAGVTVKLVAGAKDFDALAGLGIAPGLLINDAAASTTKSTTTSTSSTTTSTAQQSVGLGIDGNLNLQTTAGAKHAHSAIQAALSLIKQTYQKLNNPASATTTTTTGTAPAYLSAQLASYQTALSLFGSSSSTG